MESMSISKFKATCLAVLEEVARQKNQDYYHQAGQTHCGSDSL